MCKYILNVINQNIIFLKYKAIIITIFMYQQQLQTTVNVFKYKHMMPCTKLLMLFSNNAYYMGIKVSVCNYIMYF